MMFSIRSAARQLFIFSSLIIYSPRVFYVLIRYYIFRPIIGQDNAFLDVTDLMRNWRGIIGMLARRKVLCVILGRAFGNRVTVYNSLFSKISVSIGDNTYVGFDCNIGNVHIGSNVLISDGVTIMSGKHQHGTASDDLAFRDQKGEFKRVKIGDGAWLGAGTIVMASVGERAIVGAGSVVTNPVMEDQVVVGVPARPIASCLE